MKSKEIYKFEPELEEVILLKREKRFIAHVKFSDGRVDLAHCANTGSMKGCLIENQPALISTTNNKKRKLKYTLEVVKVNNVWIEVNTHRTNHLFRSMVEKCLIEEFMNYKILKSEQSILNSRLDFFIEMENGKKSYIEIKQVTLLENRIAKFPDSVTTRGQKHLKDLTELIKMGYGAYMVYIVKRDDCDYFDTAKDIDPEYEKLLKIAIKTGVKVIPIRCSVNKKGIYFDKFLEKVNLVLCQYILCIIIIKKLFVWI